MTEPHRLAEDEEPSRGELVGAEVQKRRRRMVLIAGLVILALARAITGFIFYQQSKATKAVGTALSALSMCLFGEQGPGDQPAVRFRHAQLAAMGLEAKDRGIVDKTAWPQRCGL